MRHYHRVLLPEPARRVDGHRDDGHRDDGQRAAVAALGVGAVAGVG
ncbi:hypothetical protein PV392_12745 [Streptomyces sp. ME03-5709C]|nr:hypothetical protein [Streptomyces sp. ME03-5709C]